MSDSPKGNGLIHSTTLEGVAVLGFSRGGIRDEREILKTLESLGRYVETRSHLNILLNLDHVEYMTSAGLGHLVGLLKKSRNSQGTLKLCCLHPPIRELFDVTRLDQIFEIHATVDAGVESFSPERVPEATP